MTAIFFVDENDLALSRALDAEHGTVVYPGHTDLPEVPRGALDDEWLPVVSTRNLVVITRDQKIRYRPAERQAWVDYAVRGFVLTGKGSQSTADSQAVLRRHWRAIRLIVDTELDGPWMRAVTNQGLRAIDLL